MNRALLVALSLTTAAVVSPGCSKKNEVTQHNNTGVTKIGPAGGIVDGPEGTELRVPAGALSEETAIGIAVAEVGEYPPQPAAYNFSGKVYSFTPHGLRFLSPVIVGVPAGSGTTVLHAAPNGSWAPLASQVDGDLLEVSVTSFSFFVSALEATGTDGGASCAGRNPDNTIAGGTFSGTGVIPSTGQVPAVDLATLAYGYARAGYMPNTIELVLTGYDHPGGYYRYAVEKIGAWNAVLTIHGPGGPVTTGNYLAQDLTLVAGGMPDTVQPGVCAVGDNAAGPAADATPALDVTTLTADTIGGQFNFTLAPGGTYTGTFNVPIVTQLTLDPARCCIP